jgi:hypothetical protein
MLTQSSLIIIFSAFCFIVCGPNLSPRRLHRGRASSSAAPLASSQRRHRVNESSPAGNDPAEQETAGRPVVAG